MPFTNGSVTCRPILMPRRLSTLDLMAFETHALPSTEYIKDAAAGWTGGRYMLDKDINEETSIYGGYIRVHLVTGERKVDNALLMSHVKEATMRRCKEARIEYLSKRERGEVYDSVYKALMEKANVQYKATSVVCPPNEDWLYTDAVSPAACDALVSHVHAAQRMVIKPMDAAALCEHLTNGVMHECDFVPMTLSDTVQAENVLHNLGCDFLTWLWYSHERGDVLFDGTGERIQLLVEGPLLFVTEGNGAHEVVLRKGVPQTGAECAACFAAGKKLASCKLSLVVGDRVWAGTFDAMEFVVRGLKLPEAEEDLDPVSHFQTRMDALGVYWRMIHSLYKQFLQRRALPIEWSELVDSMREWAKTRVTTG